MKGIRAADGVLRNTRARHVEFVVRLQIQPEFWRGAERMAQQDCRFPGDTPRAVDDFGNAIGRYLAECKDQVYRALRNPFAGVCNAP